MRNEAFLPSRHGFPCVLPTPEREDFGLGTSALGCFALSAGTVWVALDRYLTGRPLPAVESVGQSQEALLQTLIRRQREALAHAGWHQLRDWQALPARGVPGRKGLADRSRAEFRRLRQSLDDGMPVMLYLVLAQGRHADPSQNVAVLAYDYEFDRRARRASVRVYDPSRPGNDNVRLVFHAGADKGLDARLAVQTTVHGFFCVPYDRPEPASLTLQGAGNENERIATLLAVYGSAADNTFEVIGLHRNGRLIHVRRRRSGEYATEHVDVDVLDGCAIEQAAFVGSGRTVLWTSAGELIDCRRRPGLGWRARRITDTRTHGRFDGTASGVARERGRVSLFACGTGRLMHFHRGRLPAWEAEHVDAGLLARAACVGTPAGVRLGNTMHVVARTRSGELVHARWRARGGWLAENITARASDRERFLVEDDPILLVDRRGRAVVAVARSKNGSMLLFRWTERGGWRAYDLSAAAGNEKRRSMQSVSAITAAIEPDGTVHAAGRSDQGGLLHAWFMRDGTAGVQDLSQSRPRLGNTGRIDGAPLMIAGPSDGLHVLARRDSQLLLFRWAHNADWSIESLTAEREHAHGTQATLVSADDGVAHAALLDADGRVQHAMFTPRRPTGRRLRVPTWLVDVLMLPLTITGILADGVSALIGVARGSSASRATTHRAATSDGVVARPRQVPSSALQQLPEADAATPLPLLPDRAAEPVEKSDASVDPVAASEVPAVDVIEEPGAHVDEPAATEPEPVAEADTRHDTMDAAAEEPAVDVAVESAAPPTAPAEAAPSADADVDATGEATTKDNDLIVVYPEPEKRTGEGARKKGPYASGMSTAEIERVLGQIAATPSANGKTVSAKAAGDEQNAKQAASDPPKADERTSARDDSKRSDERVKEAASQREEPKPKRTESPRPDNKTKRDVAPVNEVPPENADPLPLLHDGKPSESEPAIANADPADPWALPDFEVTSPGDDWNAPDDEPWSATPVEGVELVTQVPDTDDWSLPPVEGLEASESDVAMTSDDWSLPRLEGLQDVAAEATPEPEPVAAAPIVQSIEPPDTEARTPSIADTDDDWNLPADVPAVVPQPIEAASDKPAFATGLTLVDDDAVRDAVAGADDVAVVENPGSCDSSVAADTSGREESAEAEAPRRKKWQNPALEGLPLLDYEDDAVPISPTTARQPSKANTRKKGKKASASEMERMIALAEASQPELLPPD